MKNLSRRNFLKGLGGFFGVVFAKVAKLSLPELPAEAIEQDDRTKTAGEPVVKGIQDGLEDNWSPYFARPRKPVKWMCLECGKENTYVGGVASCAYCSYGHRRDWVCPNCLKITGRYTSNHLHCDHCNESRYQNQTNSAWLGD